MYYYYTSLKKLEQILEVGLLLTAKETKKLEHLKKHVYCTTLAPSDHTKSEIVANNWNRALNTEMETGLQVCISFLEKGTSQIQPSTKPGRDLHIFSGGAKKLYQRIQCIFVDPDVHLKLPLRKLLRKIIGEHFIDVQPLQFVPENSSVSASDDSENTLDETEPATNKQFGLWNWLINLFRSQPTHTEEF